MSFVEGLAVGWRWVGVTTSDAHVCMESIQDRSWAALLGIGAADLLGQKLS